MFPEYLKLVEESVNEGASKGIDLFMESLNEDMVVEEIFTENGGIEETMKKLFMENGIDITEEVEQNQDIESIDESIDEKLDSILEQLKKEGIVE